MAQKHYKRLHDGGSPARSGLMAKPPRFDASGYRNAARLTKGSSAFQRIFPANFGERPAISEGYLNVYFIA